MNKKKTNQACPLAETAHERYSHKKTNLSETYKITGKQHNSMELLAFVLRPSKNS